ncbi:hypothetical protein ABIA31_004360 [Catenulispora sp. MAP5-51]|uniref:cell wall-binding repeat-containing protein n=1 Tax=Catenulispora sp. MAP5-51 TaxID=3156298 RepID=UPI003515E2E5
MRSSNFKKSLAASAVLASSIATAVGFSAAAHAAPAGPSNSPLTIGKGAWAPDGSRYVHANADGSIATRNLPGGAEIIVDPAKPGVARSNPTFWNNGTAIVFSETVNGTSKLVSIPTYTPAGTPVPETDPLSFLAQQLPEGTETAPDSNGTSLVFQHHNTATNHEAIYVQDNFGRGSAGPILAADNGTSPAISPDGKTVAFLRKDSTGHEQIWTVAWNGQSAQPPAGTAKQLTTNAEDHFFPTFSPDNTRIAYEARTSTSGALSDVESVSAADGSGLKQESATPGVPDYQPLVKNTETRLAGADRLGTAIAASQAQWQAGSAESVVLTRSDQFADALGGSTLAHSEYGPLLLTPSGGLDGSVKAEITRVLGKPDGHKTVYVLGGEQALSPTVFNAVKSLGYTVTRISGPDRYATSVAIAEQITRNTSQNGWGQPGRVLVATGNLAPDALSAGAAASAGEFNGPIDSVVILTNDKLMPAVTKNYLAQVQAHDVKNYATPVYGIGGQADTALTSDGVKHTGLVGTDRYMTSYLVAKTFFGGASLENASPAGIGFATGADWPDALSGGAFMAREHGPLLLVNPANWLSSDGQNYLYGWAPGTANAYIFGGTKAVAGGTTQSNIGGGISGPAGYNYVLNPHA